MHIPTLSLGMVAASSGSAGYVDPMYGNSLLLEMEGADDSVVFTDSSPIGHTVTTVGGAKIDTAWSAFGSSSGLFNGTNAYLEVADHSSIQLDTDDWTIATYIKINTTQTDAGGAGIISKRNPTANESGTWVLTLQPPGSANIPIFVEIYLGSLSVFTFSGPALTVGQKHHLEISREGSTIRGFVDGDLRLSYTTTHNFHGGTHPLRIAKNSATGLLNGHLDRLSVTKGKALHTTSFTPPGI